MSISDAEAIRRELRAIIARVGSHGKAAELLGLSQPSITDFLNGGGLGPKMLTAVLKETGKSFAELKVVGVHVQRPERTRSFTPTPAPSSSVRVGKTTFVLPELPNRTRALQLLVDRGHDREQVDEELALAAYDARLGPQDDMPVAWWLDAARAGMLRRSNETS